MSMYIMDIDISLWTEASYVFTLFRKRVKTITGMVVQSADSRESVYCSPGIDVIAPIVSSQSRVLFTSLSLYSGGTNVTVLDLVLYVSSIFKMTTNWKRRLQRFAAMTEIPGLTLLTDAERDERCPSLQKMKWCVVLLASVIIIVMSSWTQIKYFLQYETTTKVVHEMDISGIPLPPIMFCPTRGSLSASKLTVHDILNAPNMATGSVGLRRENVVEVRNGSTFIRPDASHFFSALLNDSTLINRAEASRYWGRYNYRKIKKSVSRSGGLNWRPLLEKVAQHDIDVPIEDQKQYDITEVMTRAGFSAKDNKLKITCQNSRKRVVGCPLPKDLYLSKERKLCHILDFSKSLQVSSVTARLDDTAAQSDGIYDTVHKFEWTVHVDYGKPTTQSRVFNNGTSYTILIHHVKRDVKKGPPYGQECGDNSHMAGNPYSLDNGYYSRELCLRFCYDTCYHRKIGSSLGCRSSDTPLTGVNKTLNICTTNDMLAFYREWEDECTVGCEEGQYRVLRGCPTSACDQIMYSTVEWEMSGVFETEGGVPFTYAYLEHGKGSEMTTYIEVPLFSTESLLAEVGGTMGLFLGISLITILHVVEFLLSELFNFVRTVLLWCVHCTKKEKRQTPEVPVQSIRIVRTKLSD